MSKKTGMFIVLGLIGLILAVMVGMPYLMTKVASQVAEQALQPFTQANDQLKTQVSQFVNPTPTIIPDPVTIIHEVRSLARLETIQYSVEKVITADSGREQLAFLFGDKLLFVAHGIVIAGIDLGKISSEDMQLKGQTLTMRLPAPEIFIATLDNKRSYVYDRETGLLSKGSPELETLARQAAEAEIFNAAMEDGILEKAKVNAENYLDRLLRQLGYPVVIFEYAE
jgi:hypothetical protein